MALLTTIACLLLCPAESHVVLGRTFRFTAGPHGLSRQTLASTAPPPPLPPPPPPPVFRGRDGGGDDDDGDDRNDNGLPIGAPTADTDATLPLLRSTLQLVIRFPPLIPVALFALVRPFRRAVRTQFNIVPLIFQLKLFDLQRFATEEARLSAQADMDARLSVRFAAFVGRMRGAFVKVAQILGSLDPPPVRQAYVEQLEPMAEAAPGGRAWRTVEREITRELRRSEAGRRGDGSSRALHLTDVFSEFDPEPVGTASVGQVHRAVLRGSGRTVAVKLQYPDARRLILTDLGNIHRVLKVLGKKAEAAVVREYRSRMSLEFDYGAEARTMGEVADFFDDAESCGKVGRCIVVPRPHAEWCTGRLIVMDFVQGRSLRESLRESFRRCQTLPTILRVPRLLLLQWEAKRKVSTLLDAQGAQIFRLGTFNADPHPGNVFLTTGKGGRLGLLDFGCHKSLTPLERVRLARLYVALADHDEEAIVAAAIDMGVRTKSMDRSVILDFAVHFFDRDVAPLSPPAFLLSLRARDKITSLPHEYMLVARSSLLLRGLGGKLRAPQQCARSWEGEARRYLRNYEGGA